jgi:protein associated with RNAse G/E
MTSNDKKVEVIKLNPQGEETWRYDGLVLARDRTSILIEAYFNRDDLLFNGILLKKNDRFIERYFNDRWYNIFEIHDREDDQIKGWYCNVTKPAVFTPGKIAYVDLALDVLVYPNGSYLVLDKDEFDDLEIDENSRKQAIKALDALVSLADTGHLSDMLNTNIDALY